MLPGCGRRCSKQLRTGAGRWWSTWPRPSFATRPGLTSWCAHKRVQADGGELLLVIGTAAVLRIFAVTGIDHLIPNFPTLEQALAPAPAVPDLTSPPGALAAGPAPPAAPEPVGTPPMTSSATSGAADVLLVEDDPADVLL